MTRDKWDSQATDAIKRKDPDWVYEHGYVTWKGRIYIPNNERVREAALEMAHFGHPGVAKTIEQLTRGYWWPLMKKDVERYIKGCSSCQMLRLLNNNQQLHYNPIVSLKDHGTPLR